MEVIALLLAVQDPYAADYKLWSKFKAGSSVTIRLKTGGAESELTYTLDAIDKEKAALTVRGKETRNGKTTEVPEGKLTLSAKGYTGPSMQISNLKSTEGEEEVVADGKKLKCRWTEEKYDFENPFLQHPNHHTGRKKAWTHGDVPGGIVKLEVDIDGKESVRLTVLKWEAK
jgi:hypothetical protein